MKKGNFLKFTQPWESYKKNLPNPIKSLTKKYQTYTNKVNLLIKRCARAFISHDGVGIYKFQETCKMAMMLKHFISCHLNISLDTQVYPSNDAE